MKFMVQFIRFRRGAPEVVRTLHVAAADKSTALARVKSLVGTASWPPRPDALRVMDDGGRTHQLGLCQSRLRSRRRPSRVKRASNFCSPALLVQERRCENWDLVENKRPFSLAPR